MSDILLTLTHTFDIFVSLNAFIYLNMFHWGCVHHRDGLGTSIFQIEEQQMHNEVL